MRYSDTTNKDGILQNCESLCSLGDGGITGNETLLAKFTGYVNQACSKIQAALIMVDKNWKWDDSAYSDFPRATTTLVEGQKDYTLPVRASGADASTLLRVNKIAVLNTNSQELVLRPTDLSEAELNNIYLNNSVPVVYRLIGNSVKIWPAPSSSQVTLTNGLIVYFERLFKPFTTSDTTREPGFPATYHELIPLYASAMHLLPTNPNQAANYLALFNAGLEKLQEDWSARVEDMPNRILFKYRNPR